MIYVKKMPNTDKELSDKLISKGWKQLKEPSSLGKTILFSIPFMYINGTISIFIASYLYLPMKELLSNGLGFSFSLTIGLRTLIYVAIIFVFMGVHEFIHACFIPNVLKSEKTFWGINGIYGFITTTEKIKKSRFLIISIMPFILLSVVLPFIFNFFGWLNGYTIFLCLINAMGSCVDCLNIVLIATQVPNGSYIINNGFETYFK